MPPAPHWDIRRWLPGPETTWCCFGVGFRPTTPAVAAGQPYTGAAPTTYTVQLSINNVTVLPTFAGLTSAGLYQMNLVVPSGLGTGNVPLSATVAGAQTQAGVVVSLQ